MGLYRFVLAAVVVMFHCGDFPWLAGRMAVYGFYFVSGFLITRVLDRYYLESPSALLRFYVNRALRLLPLMAVVVVLTWLFVAARGGRPYLPENRQYLPDIISTSTFLSGLRLVFLPQLDVRMFDGYPFVSFQMPTSVIPQSWSIGVELVFYLMAPLLVLAGRRRNASLSALVVTTLVLLFWGMHTTHGDFEATENHIYKNAVSSAVLFVCGAATYFAGRRVTVRIRYEVTAGLLLAWVLYLPLLSRAEPWSSSEPSNVPFVTHMLAMVPLGLIVCFTQVPEALRRLDSFLGNLSYGIYLVHILAGTMVLALGERWLIASGAPLFDKASSTGFGLTTLAISAGLAAAGFLLIERPCEEWRSKIRGTRLAPPAQLAALARPVSRTWRYGLAILPAALLVLAPLAHAQYVAGPRWPVVGVRWVPGLDAQTRRAAEATLSLECAAKDESAPDGRTYAYCLHDASTDHLRAIVQHPAVEDTGKIDRQRFVLQP